MTQIITLMTDFGLSGAPAVMKGVILSMAPSATLVDVMHTVSPQNIFEGARVFGFVSPRFPAGTVHVCVVDPGVGTTRRPIAARLGDQIFVGPDNGLITIAYNRVSQAGGKIEIYALDKPEFWLPEVSDTFHGRDIFAPVGAHLALGKDPAMLGTLISDPVLLDLPAPRRLSGGLRGEVVHIDTFGNLWTNIRTEDLIGQAVVAVRVRETDIQGLVRTFGERPVGDLVAYINSDGSLSIAVVNGSAARRLEARTGDAVSVTTNPG